MKNEVSSGHMHTVERKMMMKKRGVPSLVDLCIQVAVDNLQYLGDVGETDNHLLERILRHCTLEQLMHIENSTQGRDFSPVTDHLWKRFYKLNFGDESFNRVSERMKKYDVVFGWKQLYEANLKELEKKEQETVDILKKSYKKEDERKRSKQIQVCTKVPPSTNKRRFWGGGGPGLSNMKSGLMKKAKLQFINSREVKNIAAMKKNTLQRNKDISSNQKLGGFSGKCAASSSKLTKPVERRFY